MKNLNLIVRYAAVLVFSTMFLLSTYFAYKESRIWLYGWTNEAKIVERGRIKDDEYIIKYEIGDESCISTKTLSKKAYNSLEGKASINIKYLSCGEKIFMDLESKNTIIGLVLAVIIFGVLMWKTVSRIFY